MVIRFMDEEEFLLSKRLWKLCFPEDGDDFIDHYYSERTRPEYALGLFEDGEREPAAMMHMLPYKMRFGGEVRSVCFVAGVGTRPDRRRRGLCGRLFGCAFGIMRERGFEACVLQPFDTAFYERLGFKTFAYRRKYIISHECANYVGRTDERITPDPIKLKTLYDAFTDGYSGCSLRDEAYFASFIREYSLEDAFISASEHGCCAGYYDGEDLIVYELFFDRAAEKDLLTVLLPQVAGNVVIPLPCEIDIASVASGIPKELISGGDIEPFSMIAPLSDGFVLDGEKMYSLDRY